MITETGDHPLFGIRHSRQPTEGTASVSAKETTVWWTTPQHHHHHTLSRNLTRECYSMVSRRLCPNPVIG